MMFKLKKKKKFKMDSNIKIDDQNKTADKLKRKTCSK